MIEEEDIGVVEETQEESVGSETCLPEPMESVQGTPETLEAQLENQVETLPSVQGRRNPPRHRRRPQRYL